MAKKMFFYLLGLSFLGLLGIVTEAYAQGRQFELRQVPLSIGGATWREAAINSLAANTGIAATRSVINMSNHFPGRFEDNPFPDPTQVNQFALEILADVVVGKNLLWTFGVGSDDGFLLEIEGGTFVDVGETIPTNNPNAAVTDISGNRMFFSGLRSYAESYGVFQFPRPGIYRVRLVYWEWLGPATVDFFAGPGNQLLDLPNAQFQLINGSHPDALKLVPLKK